MGRGKWFSLLVIVCILGLFVAGCSSKTGDQGAKAPEAKAPAAKGGEAAAVQWKLQSTGTPPEQILGYNGQLGHAVELAKRVKERTNGKFDIKVYPAGALFKANELPDAVKNGAVEMAGSVGAYQSGMIPEGNLEYVLPYATKNSAEGARILTNPEYLGIIKKAYEKQNIYFLGYASISCNSYMTRFPINKLEDLKGKKISAIGSSAQVAAAHGAIAVNLDQAERYMALQRGTVDGAIFPSYGGITYKFFEVAKYQSWPAISTVNTCDFLVNMNAWNKLPKEYQTVLQEEMDKYSKYTFEVAGPALEKIGRDEAAKQFNVQNIDLSDAEFERFRQAVQPAWDSMGSKNEGCAQLVKITKQIAGIK